MVDRSVTVRLRADISQYQRSLAEAAVATQGFGRNTDAAGKQIDKLSGRLRVMADAALTLGPALIPLGAATIPAITASLAGLGAAAGGIGVTVLALHGIGDGIKAIQSYHLEPTAENFAKMREEMEKLGPSGAHFAHFLDDLGPTLHDLQLTARDGLFPGVEDGIDDLLTRLPQVKRIVADLSEGMGELAREAGEGLASDKFTAFFDYVESDARPTLEAFARSAGNVAEGVANLFVAFAPLNRDFTGGLEDATAAFARWSEGLDENQSFQAFVDYIRESGPQAVEFLGALVDALAGLVKAAAPMGQAVLPALTAVARVFAAIGNSPVGPALYTAAAAFVAFRRAASLTNSAVTGVSGSIKRLGAETQTTSQKIGLLGARGGVVFAGAAAVGALADSINRIDTNNLDRSLTALGFGNVTDTISKVVSSLEELEATRNKIDVGTPLVKLLTLGTADSSMEKFANNVDQVDQSLAQMVEGGNADQAADLFAKITALAQESGVSADDTARRFDAYALALQNLADTPAPDALDRLSDALGGTPDALGSAGSEADYFAAGLRGAAGAADKAADSTRTLNDVLKHLGAQLQRRSDARDYQAAIDDFTKSMKDNGHTLDINTRKGRANQEALDGIAAAARQMVQDLHGTDRAKALTQARKDFVDAATKILGSRDAAQKLANQLGILNNTRSNPKVNLVGADSAASTINQVTTMLRNLNGTTATTYVRTVRNDIPLPGRSADGGSVPKDGGGYSDRFLYLLAPGEEVISNRHGEADRYRAHIKGRMADGGTTGYMRGGGDGAGPAVQVFTSGAYSIAKALKAFKAELEAAKKSLEKERQTRDDLQSQFDSIKSTVGGAYSTNDPFAALQQSGSVWAAGGGMGNPLAAFDTAVAGNTANTKAAEAALAFAASHGLDGPLYAALAASGNLPLLQAFANLSSAEIDQREQAFAAQSNAQSALGGMAANAQVGAQLADANKELNQIRREVQALNHAVREADKNNQKAQDKNAKDVKDGVNGAASNGHRRSR